MDEIFRKTTTIFDVVKIAKDQPHRYGKKGELLINYEDTEEHTRRSSVAAVPKQDDTDSNGEKKESV